MTRSFINTTTAVLTCVLSVAFATDARAEGKKRALLVGVKKYEHSKLDPLEYTENDVTELATLLRPAGYEVTLLTDAAGARESRARTRTKSHRVVYGWRGLQEQ